MSRVITSTPRRLLGGAAGQSVGLGGLNQSPGGVLSPTPNWMRGGTAGTLMGWFTPTATISNLNRLWFWTNASDTNKLDCYAEPGSNRWQFMATFNSVARSTCFINGTMPATGQTRGFCFTWNPLRIRGAIGTNDGGNAPYPQPAFPPTGLANLYLGNVPGGNRQLLATFHAVEFLAYSVPDTMVAALAARPRPVPVPR